MKHTLLISLSIVLLLASVAAAQTNRSVYTPLEEKYCRTLKTHEKGYDGFEAGCPGTKGYSLLLSEGDLRQNITVFETEVRSAMLD